MPASVVAAVIVWVAYPAVERMDPGTHPMARMMVRTVRAGKEDAFHDALIARTSFLAEQDYPLPVEGFVTLSGNPGTALQVVFPTDWVSFYGTNSFKAFVEALSPADKEAYAEIKASLMETMSRAEFYDGLVTIAGGKLTTYRRMAGRVMDVVLDAVNDDGRDTT